MDNYDLLADDFYRYTKQQTVTDYYLGYRVALAELGDISGKQVLDYGCGNGLHCERLYQLGAHVTGVDQSDEMIARGRGSVSREISFRTVSNNQLHFIPAGTIDYVCCNFVLCCLPTVAEVVTIVRELKRVLRRGGKLVVLDCNFDQFLGRESLSSIMRWVDSPQTGQAISFELKSTPPVEVLGYYRSQADFRSLFRQADFQITKFQEPLATNQDHPWMDERQYSPYYIITAEK